ncbi:acetyl esterase/lipase [Acinetobacter baylyi]|uniref:Acetyl esterase/lipase n=2 Tax=Acinetobacter baylyi TaxID=202950 RepID=A0ABU0UTZ1_ACIBI|nr:acetyl esterase/lipase [Acinetobacter baylyi]MDR6105013.1 acetyl esterase/lipase [Acinetobacter baylyi]
MKIKMFISLFILTCLHPCYGHPFDIILWDHHVVPNSADIIQNEQLSKTGSITRVSTPRLHIYRPTYKQNHAAILVISGGGYAHEELGHEGTPTSKYLQKQGFTVFELVYRLPQEGWTSPLVPFQDGQRAMRIIRSQSKFYGYDSDKIGIIGFSAGGHLAGILSTTWKTPYYPPTDAIDTISSRPNFSILIYPVISMIPPLNHTHAYKSLLGIHSSLADQQALSVQLLVTPETPPTFIAHAKDDPVSSVKNSILLHQALDKNHVINQMILFPDGGHGWGLGKKGTTTTQWPALMMQWLKETKII